jgi:MFS family permease
MSNTTIASTGRIRFTRALRSRPFALLWTGQTISALGDGAFATALAWQVLLLTHSATAMGIVEIATITPTVVFLLIGGVAADRLPRRLVMLWSDGGRAVLVLAVALLGRLDVLQLWHLILLALGFGVVRAFFFPAYQSIVPDTVNVEALPSANALTGLSRQLSLLLGPLLGGAFIALASPAAAFAFDGATFLVSAVCLLILRLPAPTFPGVEEGGVVPGQPPRQRVSILADVREGLGYVMSSSWLWVTILIFSLGNVGFAGPETVALPKLVADTYHQGPWLLGTLATALALGTIAATLVIGQVKHVGRRGLVAYLGCILSGLAFIVYGLPLPRASLPLAVLAASVVFGFGVGIFEIIWVTVLQELVPKEKLGRVSSIDAVGSFGLLPLGYGLAGVLADRFGPPFVFIAGGVMNLVLFVAALLLVPGIRNLR